MTDEVRQEDREAAENVIRAWVLLGAGDDNQLPRYIALGIDSVASPLRTRIAELEGALEKAVARSHNDPIGTSKVIDMREIAIAALGGKQDGR